MKKITLAIFIAILFIACEKDNTNTLDEPKPSVTNFSFISPDASIYDRRTTPIEIIAGEEVEFGDMFLNNANSIVWLFPGGTPSSSSVEEPTVLYETEGTYDASLVAINDHGTDTFTCEDCIVVISNVQTLLNKSDGTTGIFFQRILKQKPLDSLYGKLYKGGLIFYVDSINKNGYVTASQDQSTGAPWCGSSNSFISTGTSIDFSFTNTNNMEANCPNIGSSADLCANLNLSGYTDWVLPSYYGVYYMYQNLHLKGMGGFTNTKYWTSSQSSSSWATCFDFIDGSNQTESKQNLYHVRAIRSFSN